MNIYLDVAGFLNILNPGDMRTNTHYVYHLIKPSEILGVRFLGWNGNEFVVRLKVFSHVIERKEIRIEKK